MKLPLGVAVWTFCLQTVRALADGSVSHVSSKKISDDPIIPHRLIFTYKTNMLETKEPVALYDNVQNTIKKYSEIWNVAVDEVDVMFIDDEQCLDIIPQVEPRLLEYFKLEPLGSFKADICRVAALHLYGGYYFDVDIQVLKPLQPNPEVDFVTSTCGNNQFFQAVLALSRQHPLARATLDSMLDDWYFIPSVVEKLPQARLDANFSMGEEYLEARGEYLSKYFNMSHEIKPMLGTATLRMAYDRNRNLTSAWILDELDNVDNPLYPEWKREETNWGCNYMVHDAPSKIPYFYSRCKGTDGCPFYKTKTPTELKRSSIGNAMARRRSRFGRITRSKIVPAAWRKRKRPLAKVIRRSSSIPSTPTGLLLFMIVLMWLVAMFIGIKRHREGQEGGKKNC